MVNKQKTHVNALNAKRMNEGSPGRKLSEILQPAYTSLTAVSRFFEDESDVENVIKGLEELKLKWTEIIATLSEIFVLNFGQSEVRSFFRWILEGKLQFYGIYQSIGYLEFTLTRVLDAVEKFIDDGVQSASFIRLFDLAEITWSYCQQVRPTIDDAKYIFETSLEFNEIFNDLLGSLNLLALENLRECEKLRSNTSYTNLISLPPFSRDKLVTVLSSCADTAFFRAPTFEETEKVLFERFYALDCTTKTLDLSLKDELRRKLDKFEKRNVRHVVHLSAILWTSFDELSHQYLQLLGEVAQLRAQIIEKRWSLLFDALHLELLSAVKEISDLLDKNGELGSPIRARKLEEIKIVTDIMCDISMQAMEAGILKPPIAEKFLNLLSLWETKRVIIESFPSSPDLEEQLVPEFQNLTIREPSLNKSGSRPRADSLKVGALLHKRLNLHPVIIDKTPKSAQKKTFSYSKSLVKSQPTLLKFSHLPDLQHEDVKGSYNRDNRLSHKIHYYAAKRTSLPVLKAPRFLSPLITPIKEDMPFGTQFTSYGSLNKDCLIGLKSPTDLDQILPSRKVMGCG
ncbi:LAMI_0B08372g1_1 [Lachancea mirantina]|uniref:LAMI_0B08372g1_1 n=1 Tax=Lachancea mirantina TaxID=1230905 RepID=A0A1G4IYE3_9SACH|nr:LAMI_0B08372g1_1 [Lachancea mirantina]